MSCSYDCLFIFLKKLDINLLVSYLISSYRLPREILNSLRRRCLTWDQAWDQVYGKSHRFLLSGKSFQLAR